MTSLDGRRARGGFAMGQMNGRVRTLEREVRRRVGCPTCRGREVVGLAEDEPWPAWLNARGCCRDCGRAVKLVDRDLLDAL